MLYLGQELGPLNSDHSILLGKWRQNCIVSLRQVISDPTCLESCTCNFFETSVPTIDLSNGSDDNITPAGNGVWLQNLLYTLAIREQQMIQSLTDWINDNYFSCSTIYGAAVSKHVWA